MGTGAMSDKMPIENSLFVAKPLSGDRCTWTLASRLGDMLQMAEEFFGTRDLSYTILGTEFHDGNPQICYPRSGRHVVIRLASRCMWDAVEAHCELAQECIHLLAPSGTLLANVLEEGLSIYFAQRYLKERLGETRTCDATNYSAALKLVQRLLAIDSTVVRRVRQTQPAIYLLTPADLSACNPSIPCDLAEQLTTRFAY